MEDVMGMKIMKSFFKQSLLLSLLLAISSVTTYAADYYDGVTHISAQELAEKLKNPNAVLIDIRRQDEVDRGYIAGAVHIPITGIMKDISLLDEHVGKDLIFYCHVGVRVNILTDFLQKIDHPSKDKLYHLKGDMRAWRAEGNEVLIK